MWNKTLIQYWINYCGNKSLCLDFVKQLINVNSSSILNLQKTLNADYRQVEETELELFHRRFSRFHGIAGIIVCIIGVLVSSITLSILCRKKLRTATNLLLSAMAVSDMLNMLLYIPIPLVMYIPDFVQLDMDTNLIWEIYYLFSVMLTATSHTYSVWLGVALSIIRFCQVRKSKRYPTMQKKWMKKVKVSILVSFVIAVLSLSPFYYQICHQALSGEEAPEALDFTKGSSYSSVLLYAILSKIIPSILMTISGIYIIKKMISRETRRRRGNLGRRQQKGPASTKILLVLISLFVISELPQGTIMILGISWPESFSDIYHLSGDLQDFVAIVVSAINFILYCLMSKVFRSEFATVFLKCISRR